MSREFEGCLLCDYKGADTIWKRITLNNLDNVKLAADQFATWYYYHQNGSTLGTNWNNEYSVLIKNEQDVIIQFDIEINTCPVFHSVNPCESSVLMFNRKAPF